MKRMTILLALLCALCACGSAGTGNSAAVELGESRQFSQKELEAAVECLEAYFRGHFRGCTMERIWYDEADSQACAASYLYEYNGPVENGVTEGNVISLFGDFTTGNNPPAGLSANQTYPYRWLMIRDDADSPWRMDMRASGQG